MSASALGGVASAAVAAACFDGGLAVQALDARQVPREHGLHPKLLARLVRRRRWVAATALAFGGWPFHLLALALAPLSLVQPTLALGLVLLLYLGHRLLGERVGRTEMVAVAGVVGAVAVLAWAAPPETRHHADAARLALGLVPVGLFAVAPLLARRVGIDAPVRLLPFATGAAYAFTGVVSKLVVDDLRAHAVAGLVLWVGLTALVGMVGLLLEMSSLQVLPATHVGPNVFVIQTTVPVLLAPLVSGESWSATPLSGGVILIAVAVTAISAAVLTRSPAIAAFADAAASDQREDLAGS
jgi:drug/metabolite transporter (DMT)-like permease